jgi:hypothetical protein
MDNRGAGGLNMKNKLGWIVAVLALPSMALAADGSMFKLSGFGTVGMTYSGESDADFRTGLTQPNGPGRTAKTTWDTDSKFGVQADVFFIPNKLTATVQVLADQNADKTFTPGLEWANLKWQATQEMYLRGGRLVAPTFMMSESRSVGYTQTTIRPPADTYFLNPITFIDGVDAGYQFGVGESLVNLQMSYGNYSDELSNGGVIDADIDALLFNSTVEYGDLSVRLGLAQYDVSLSSAAVTGYNNLVSQLVAGGVPNAAEIQSMTFTSGIKTNIVGLGFSYDPGSWLLQGELVKRSAESRQVTDLTSAYLLGGVRLGKWTPYGLVSMIKSASVSIPSIDPLIAGAPAAGAVNGSSKSLMTKVDRTTVGLGVRYDVYKNLAIKAEYDHIQKPANSTGAFANRQGTFVVDKRSIDLFGLALDFVF